MKKHFVLALVALISTSAYSGEGHNHEAAVEPAPHGGVLRDAPPYKAELVLEKELARVFIYTKTGDKLVPAVLKATELKGHVRLPKDKKEKAVTFRKKGDAYESTIAGISKVHRFDLHVDLEQDGKKVVLDFGIDNIH